MAAPIVGGTTPKVWLKADSGVYSDAGSTLATNGQTVRQWNDQSGNANHCSQATAGARPTFSTNIKNSLPALLFNGTTSVLDQPFTGEPLTVFLVAYWNSLTSYQTLMGADTSDAVAVGAYYIQKTSAGEWAYYRCTSADTTGAADFGALSNSPNPSVSTWYILKARRSGTTIQAESRCGHNAWFTGTSSNTVRPVSGTPKLGAGYYGDAVADYFNGYMAEVLVYDSALSVAEAAQVEWYLHQKYGLGVTSPSYVMSTFEDAGIGGTPRLLMFESADGLSWYVRPVGYAPLSGYVRDPSITYFGAKWWLCHTNVTDFTVACTSFAVASSDDGVAFTHVTNVDCSAAASGASPRTWAPEWTFDASGSPHILVAIDSDGTDSFTIHKVSPTNAALTSWGTPAAIDLGGITVIDPFQVYHGGNWYLWVKREAAGLKYYEVYKSSSQFSGYSGHRTGDWLAYGSGYEGASVIRLLDGTWRVWLDEFGTANRLRYGTQTAGDWTGSGSTTWAALTNVTVNGNVPSGYRPTHGTVTFFPLPPEFGYRIQLPNNRVGPPALRRKWRGPKVVLTSININNYTVTVSSAPFIITGISASLLVSHKITSSAAAFILTGGTSSLKFAHTITTSAASFVLTGKSASITDAHVISATLGSFTLTGGSTSTVTTRTISASPASFTLSGLSAGLAYNPSFPSLLASPGSFILTGIDAALPYNHTVTVSSSSYSLTGESTSFLRNRVLILSPATFTFAGRSAVISYSGTPTTPRFSVALSANVQRNVELSASAQRNVQLTANAGASG